MYYRVWHPWKESLFRGVTHNHAIRWARQSGPVNSPALASFVIPASRSFRDYCVIVYYLIWILHTIISVIPLSTTIIIKSSMLILLSENFKTWLFFRRVTVQTLRQSIYWVLSKSEDLQGCHFLKGRYLPAFWLIDLYRLYNCTVPAAYLSTTGVASRVTLLSTRHINTRHGRECVYQTLILTTMWHL